MCRPCVTASRLCFAHFSPVLRAYLARPSLISRPYLGPLPQGLVFDFSRLNLPKCIEFHGQPDFPPDEDPLYNGKQFLALHELAYFFVKPIRIESAGAALDETSQVASAGMVEASEAAGADGDAEGEQVSIRVEGAESEVVGGKATGGEAARPEGDDGELQLEYTVLIHVKVTGKPQSDLPLFSIPMRFEGRNTPPTVALTTAMRVLPNFINHRRRCFCLAGK